LSEFISNVFKLVSGSVIAQILGVVLIPIITRLYLPEDFGLFSLILAMTGIIAIFSSLSYQLAIMLPREDGYAAHIVALCCGLILFSSVVMGLILLFFADPIANALKAPALARYLWFVPFLVFFTAVFSVFTYWNSRRKRFRVKIINFLSRKGIQIGICIAVVSPFGLILEPNVGYANGIMVMLQGFYEDLGFLKQVITNRVRELDIRFKNSPLWAPRLTTANAILIHHIPYV